MSVSQGGTYTFISQSTTDMYIYFYNGIFDPLKPYNNLNGSDDDSANNLQFRLNMPLQSHHTYIIVITTFTAKHIANFSIVVSGPANAIILHWVLLPFLLTNTTSTTLMTTTTATIVGK